MKWEQIKNFLLQPAEPMIYTFLSHGLDSELSEEAIKALISSAIHDSIRDWAKSQKPIDITEKSKIAQVHLSEAINIVKELQNEIGNYNHLLSQIAESVDEKKQVAEHWERLANINQEVAQALTQEIESRVSRQIRNELDRDKRKKQIISALFYVLAIFLGAIAGYYVPQWIQQLNLP